MYLYRYIVIHVQVAACAESSLGSELLHAVGQETLGLEPPLTMVPWLLFNEATSSQPVAVCHVTLCSSCRSSTWTTTSTA